MVSAALIWFVVRMVNWVALGGLLEKLDWRWAVLGSMLVPVVMVGMAVRWRIFLRQQGLTVSFPRVFQLTWAGQFFNSVLPGSTGGDVVKIVQLCRTFPTRKAAAAATIVADRFSALFALVVMGAASFILDPVPIALLAQQRLSVSETVLWAGGLVLLGTAVAALILRMGRFAQVRSRLGRMLQAMKSHVVLDKQLLAAFALALGVHCVNFLSFYCFARSLALSISYLQVLVMLPVLLFFMLLPVTINGHGLRELLLMAYFSHLGIALAGSSPAGVQEMAVGVSLLAVANELLWNLPGGIWYLSSLRMARSRAEREAFPVIG